MILLTFDTTTEINSIALAKNNEILANETFTSGFGIADSIIPHIESLIQKANLTPQDIQAVGATIGPGSFTGVRIGLAIAKAFGLALNIPIYGITTLKALGYGLKGKYTAIIDTKRGDFYAQEFENGIPINEPFIATPLDLENKTLIKPNSKSIALSLIEIILKNPNENLNTQPFYLKEADVSI